MRLCAAVQPRMTLARTLKLYKLPEQKATKGLRPLESKDVSQVCFQVQRLVSLPEVCPWQEDIQL